jgi:hypothetical protein
MEPNPLTFSYATYYQDDFLASNLLLANFQTAIKLHFLNNNFCPIWLYKVRLKKSSAKNVPNSCLLRKMLLNVDKIYPMTYSLNYFFYPLTLHDFNSTDNKREF